MKCNKFRFLILSVVASLTFVSCHPATWANRLQPVTYGYGARGIYKGRFVKTIHSAPGKQPVSGLTFVVTEHPSDLRTSIGGFPKALIPVHAWRREALHGRKEYIAFSPTEIPNSWLLPGSQEVIIRGEKRRDHVLLQERYDRKALVFLPLPHFVDTLIVKKIISPSTGIPLLRKQWSEMLPVIDN